MKNDLERDLGLYATVTISMGAMIGSGIFVLPALGLKKAGPAVILAYILAGLVVLPAALSKAEMATAMPESGGTYLYIDRAMGPLAGTIAGIGAWFSLVFKSSFALVGLGAYLLLLVPISDGLVKIVALGLAALIIVLNIVGTEQSGKAQSIIVTAVVFALAAYVLNSGFVIEPTRFQGFTDKGASGIVTAAAFVFVSYAGVTKIASVAEEIENPDRNLPLGILISMGAMMLLYTLVVAAIVGLNDPGTLTTSGPNGGPSLTPMADGAGQLLGGVGVVAIALIAILALTSMANAGVLASSRFPLAMSRDSLAPSQLARVSKRFSTPRNSILITGALLLMLIAFVPVVELAKLASAFQILVFSIVNVALIVFRTSGVDSYQPSFESPGYPYVQFAGFIGGLVLLTQMGMFPILGAAGIIVGGVGWYLIYGRSRTSRDGALGTILEQRQQEGEAASSD
ncbi:APC family permease [Haloquadratum walsbyi]|uniref:Amino acid transporter n=1 Tax=Haloquadratum walsbyi J07HQW2 TaxID=1238425 RepID=U1PLA7_9EURY|nr:APC family permease [Haloquadratum walsbyi]ERG94477.1 MAG: amino acid transporter [Haloquadratum walsbyi J07HQW2]